VTYRAILTVVLIVWALVLTWLFIYVALAVREGRGREKS